MKTLAVAVEGVLAREPVGEPFASSAALLEGLWLKSVLQAGTWTVLVTGSYDAEGVRHFLRSNGIDGGVGLEIPTLADEAQSPLWHNRLAVLDRINRQHRGNLVVVDASRVIRDAMLSQGAMVVQPWFSRARGEVGADEYVPLRQVSKFWD